MNVKKVREVRVKVSKLMAQMPTLYAEIRTVSISQLEQMSSADRARAIVLGLDCVALTVTLGFEF